MEEFKEQWWVLSTTQLLEALRRVATGENPDLILAEMYANAETERS